jgi:hypothetical protein
MRRKLRKIVVFLLAVGLTVSAPALSHAQVGAFSGAAPHESHDVQHYADLSIEPGDEACPHSAPAHDQDGGLCKKCCAACLGAILIPYAPEATSVADMPGELMTPRENTLVARAIPAEPGIPKPL